jgi:hypothetical protein
MVERIDDPDEIITIINSSSKKTKPSSTSLNLTRLAI